MAGPETSDPQGEIDALYDLAPEDFVAARGALAKKLRAAGQRDAAATVAALRRPTVVAWALNQAARRHPDAIERLLDTTARLATAQQSALDGGDRTALRTVMRERREAFAAVVSHATAVLAGRDRAGGSEDFSSTLDAASTNPEAAADLRAGRLSREPEASPVFDVFASAAPEPSSRAAAPRPAKQATGRKTASTALHVVRPTDDDGAPRADAAALHVVRPTRDDTRRATAADAAAAKAAARARQAVERAQAESERRNAGAEEAEAQAQAARQALEEAHAEVERLRDALATAEDAAAKAARDTERSEATAARALAQAERADEELRAAQERLVD